MPRIPLPLILLATALGSPQCFAASQDGAFARNVRPILDAHCFKCHGEQKQKGGLELASFANEGAVLKKHKIWRSVLEQVELKDMPPEDETPLTDAERSTLLAGIRGTLALLETDHPSLLDPGPGELRRLSHAEYNNSIRGLLGIEFDAAKEAGMTEENVGHGYANLASALIIPPSMMEKYFDAADTILARLFADSDVKSPDKRKDQTAFKALFADVGTDREAAQVLLSRLIRRAFRRPADPAEIERALNLFDAAATRGDSFPAAVRRAIKPLLVSPNFLFRVEENQAPDNSRAVYRVTDVELASRLSFFLWSSSPDELLLALAEKQELSQPAMLETQVKRMLADPKAKALTENFSPLAATRTSSPKRGRARSSSRPSTTSMKNGDARGGRWRFATTLRTDDRRVLDLLDADYTFANERLGEALRPRRREGQGAAARRAQAGGSSRRRARHGRRSWRRRRTPIAPARRSAASGCSTSFSARRRRRRRPTPRMFKDEKKTKEPKDFREKLAQHATRCHLRGLPRRDGPARLRPRQLRRRSARGAPTSARTSTRAACCRAARRFERRDGAEEQSSGRGAISSPAT